MKFVYRRNQHKRLIRGGENTGERQPRYNAVTEKKSVSYDEYITSKGVSYHGMK